MATMALTHDGTVASEEDSSSPLRRLAWPIGVLCLLVCATTATLVYLNRSAIHGIDSALLVGYQSGG